MSSTKKMWSKLSSSSPTSCNPTRTTTTRRRQPVGTNSPSSKTLSATSIQFLIITFLIIIGVFAGSSFQQQHHTVEANAPISLNRVSALIAWNSDGVTLKATTSGLSEDDKQNCFYWTTLHPELVSLVPVNKISDDQKIQLGSSPVMTCSQEIQVCFDEYYHCPDSR